MRANSIVRSIAFLGFTASTICLTGCTASSQGLSSRGFDTLPASKPSDSKSQPADATAAPVLNVDLSVDAAYAAIPHRRTAMDFSSANLAEEDKRFLQVAFHVIDQAIRVRVSAYQHFSRGEISSQSISDMEQLIDYLQKIAAPSGLSRYQSTLLKALSDQRDFFDEWRNEGQQFQYGQRLGAHPRVQSASSALKQAYGILMSTYPGESDHNKEAFFDYHCALDFL